MIDPTEITTLLRYVLRQVEDAAVTAAFELPGRRYVTVGGSVFDCEQVTVSAMNAEAGTVSSDPGAINLIGSCAPTWNATLEIAIVTCASEKMTGRNGNTPAAVEVVEADAERMSAAYAVLRDALETMVASGDIGTPSATITFGQPEGGLIAAVMSLNANIWISP